MHKSSQHLHSGFTLIEVLVAVLLLSLGMLGLVALENLSLKNNNSAYQRSQATILGYDLTDRVRANVIGRAFYISDFDSASSAISCPCTPRQRARKDLGEWKEKLSSILPEASASLAESSGQITLDITWRDHRERKIGDQFDLDDQYEKFSTTFQP